MDKHLTAITYSLCCTSVKKDDYVKVDKEIAELKEKLRTNRSYLRYCMLFNTKTP